MDKLKLEYNSLHKRYEYQFKNNKDEEVLIWIYEQIHDRNYKGSLMNLWVNHKYLDKFIDKTWQLDLYVTDKKGNCWNKYNPCIIPNENKINFRYILESTEENLKILINKCIEMANREEQ